MLLFVMVCWCGGVFLLMVGGVVIVSINAVVVGFVISVNVDVCRCGSFSFSSFECLGLV